MSTPFDHIPSCSRTADYTKPTATAPTSRLEEVEAEIANLDDSYSARTYTDGYADLARTLAAEVDAVRAKLADWEVAAQQGHPSPCTLGTLCPYCEIDRLRGKLDDVRMGIGCARGQRSTQYCAEVDARDAVITELLAMLEPDDHESKCNCDECRLRRETYARAVAIAESCTETTTTKKDHEQ